eukprot:CAMPEP_0119039010 /NCGR_PEP_ID=MMETSP1177-20130426/8258_1 /TAXON_ID=2985 /ORGANISM="Ochromonas sp, Strain CCMP1899" /LENGTH=288 /DNA_ID=CAMNT_0007002327 /DNA_START=66 /DNA_END=929 /DNA_ORIENTATION=-
MFSFKRSSIRTLVALSSPLVVGQVSSNHTKCQGAEYHKRLVGYESVDYFVKDGMVIGLGTGSTAIFAAERLSQLIKKGSLKRIQVIPCSQTLRKQCIGMSIPIFDDLSDEHPVDIMIDGANEVDLKLNLIKGGSGAFLREKMIQERIHAGSKIIIVVEDYKLTKKVGVAHPVPVEVIPFSHENTRRVLENEVPAVSGCRAILRRGNVNNIEVDGLDPAVTDNGNFIVDLYFDKPIDDVSSAVRQINALSGVVGHGLFEGKNGGTAIIVAGDRGTRIAALDGKDGEEPW